MKARIVRIGNSRGIRLPKPLIEEAGLSDEVELRARDGAIVIARAARPRAGWERAARLARARGDDRPAGPHSTTRFDRAQWKW
jgi:antitoxin MazE